MDIQKLKQRLHEVKDQLENGEIDEIPLDARPKMLNFDFDKESYVVVSYSRKDFEDVYLFLAYLYNEGYRFWYDNGMKGTEKWLKEYREKFENPNCLGTITFFSDNYISNSTKEELDIIYSQTGYAKRNIMISLIPLDNIDSNKILINAVSTERITIPNAAAILPVLSELIKDEKDKTIYRLSRESDIPYLVSKIGEDYSIHNNSTQNTQSNNSNDFAIRNNALLKYAGTNSTVVVPDSVTSIDTRAFEGCTLLEEIKLGKRITHIGSSAFRGCTALTSIEFLAPITDIGSNAFDGCKSLTNISLPQGISTLASNMFKGCVSLTRLSIPNSVTHIGGCVFKGCSSLSSILLPDNVKSIGSMVFEGCTSLTHINMPSNLAYIGRSAFKACTSLRKINLPNSITNIERNTFVGCKALKSITIPNSVTTIERNAFVGCTSLENIVLSHNTTNIGMRAFAECTALTSFVIPDGVTDIKRELFRQCKVLSYLRIPDSVKTIGKEAFAQCCSLEMILYSGTKKQWDLIEKANDWNDCVKYIKCVDGIISLQ